MNDRAALRRELTEATRRAEALRQIIESISSELALEPLLTRILKSAVELIGAQYGTIGLVVERGGGPVVKTAAIYSMPPEELGAEMPPGIGLAGCVLQERRALILKRYGDLDQPTLPALAEHSVIGLPIWWADQMIGFFGIGVEPPRCFDQRDRESLELFARYAAIAIENARRYLEERQRGERLALIARVGQRITARLEPDELFSTVVTELHEGLGYEHVSLFILDPADPTWLVQRARASRWPRGEAEDYRQSIEEGILGVAARQRAPELVKDVASDARYIPVPQADEMRTELAMPILLGDRLLGVLDVAGSRSFHQDDITGIQIIADQLAVAIDNAQLFAATQRALNEAQLLYNTSRRISTAMTVDEVITAYLEQVATRGHYACTIVLYEFDALGRRTFRVAVGRWTAEEGIVRDEVRHPFLPDALDPPLDAGQTITISDVTADSRVPESLRTMQVQAGRLALAMIPLIVRGQRIGLVVLSYPGVHHWRDSSLRPYQVTAAQLATAIENRRQHLLVYQQRQQVAILDERRRLARELHDSVTQSLFSMSLLAQVLPDLWELDQAEARGMLTQIRDLTRGALAEMRALLFELRPAAMGEHELAQALQHHAAVFEHRTGIPISVEVQGEIVLPSTVEEALFRIAQEAMTNIARHARARRVRLSLRGGTPVRLSVADDGQGFQPEMVGSGHIGLISMRERAAAIGARVEIHSAVGHGTEIIVEWPDPMAGTIGGER